MVTLPPRAPSDSAAELESGLIQEQSASKSGNDAPGVARKSPRRGFSPPRSMVLCLCGLALVATFALGALLISEQAATQAYSKRAERGSQLRMAGSKLGLNPWLDSSISAAALESEEEHSADEIDGEAVNIEQEKAASGGTKSVSDTVPDAQRRAQKEGKPRVALLFFGLSRSLMLTLPSIREYIFRPLEDAGFNPTVFVHTYEDALTADKRKSAASTAVEDEWKLLEPFQYVTTSQAAFLETAEDDVQRCYAVGTGWVNTKPRGQEENVRNLLCQLNSVKEVAALWHKHWKAHQEEYAAVAFVRPDVLYRDEFPVGVISHLKEGEVHVPQWGNSKGGINDRFALLHPRTASIWGDRLDFTTQHCLDTKIHAEVFCRDFAAARDLRVKKLNKFVFFRVRANGSIGTSDKTLPGYAETVTYIERRQQALSQRAAQQLEGVERGSFVDDLT